MYQTIERVLDFFYPPRCPVCDEALSVIDFRKGRATGGALIHEGCRRKISYIRGNTCMKCGKPLGRGDTREYCDDCAGKRHLYTRGFSVFSYRTISGSIYRFKYMGRQEYARFYAAATRRLLGERLKKLGIEALVPVPMYHGKLIKRGYNQAEVYAAAVSRELGIPVYPDLIQRIRDTAPMKQLDASGRRNNLKKAFIIAKNDVKFKCILVIDDIYTTGSTIDEITQEFRIAGVRKVYFLTLSIGQTT